MSIFSKIATKKQFINLIEKSDFIYNEANKCLNPANKVFWFYYLRIKTCVEPCNHEQLKMSLTAFSKYIDQLYNLEKEISSFFQKHEKDLLKCKTLHKNSLKNFSKLQINVKALDKNIKDLEDYENYESLLFILKTLDEIQHKFKIINFSKYQSHELMT